MKTRIVHTRFWQDNFVLELKTCPKFLFMYVLTNERIGLTGGYECPDKFLLLETGLSPDQLEASKQALKAKVLFKDGWIGIKNATKYNNYSANKIHQSAYKKELDSLPEFIRSFILVKDYSPTSLGLDRNKKQEIRNKNTEIRKEDLEESGTNLFYRRWCMETDQSVPFPKWLETNLEEE